MRRIILSVALGLGLVGCASNSSPLDTPDPKVQPLTEQMLTLSTTLKQEKPERLDREGVALIVAGGFLRAQKAVPLLGVGQEGYGDRDNAWVWLDGTSVMTIVHTASEGDDLGWGVVAVKPGSYHFSNLFGGRGSTSVSVGRSQMGNVVGEALGDKIDVKAGEVVYIGSFVGTFSAALINKERPNVEILNETDRAKTFISRNYPTFLTRLKTRIMPCNLCKLIAEKEAALAKANAAKQD